MANIPNANYPVTVAPPTNGWLNGTLNTKVSPPTYKSQTTTNANLDENNVGWTVVLNNAGADHTVTFTGGKYSSTTNPKIQKGTYTMTSGAKNVAETGDDTWTAQQESEEDSKAATTYTP